MERAVTIVSYAAQSRGPVLSGMMLDNGAALVAAHLLRSGYVPKVFDYNSLRTVERIVGYGRSAFVAGVIDELCAHIAHSGARMLGFKLYANGFADSVRIASDIKRRFPKLLVVGGGPQVEWFGETVFEYAQKVHGRDVFDVLTYGDCDTAIVKLAGLAYGTGTVDDIPNLLFRDSTGNVRRSPRAPTRLNELPYPEYDPEVYDTTGKVLIPVVEDSRGCENACTFCVHPRIGGKLRTRDLEHVVAEIEHTRRRYGFRVFRLAGPKPSSQYINALARALPQDARFTTFAYAGQHYEDAAASKKIIGLFLGIESADARILRSYRKTNDVEGYLQAAREVTALFKRNGLATVMSMIFPSPDESTESMRRSLDFLRAVQPDFVPFLPVGPIPNTPLTRSALANPEEAGVMLEDEYALKLIGYELDLLRPPAEWPPGPMRLRVNGQFISPFEVAGQFSAELMASGLYPLSDEQVLMAYLYNGGLSLDQARRREQCLGFNNSARQALQRGDVATLRKLIETVNRNQCGGT